MNNRASNEQLFDKMLKVKEGKLPKVLELSIDGFPKMIEEYATSNSFSLLQKRLLEEETRTLIYLGIALTSGSKACIEEIMHKAKLQHITKDKIIDVFTISLHAASTRVLSNAEIIFDYLKKNKK